MRARKFIFAVLAISGSLSLKAQGAATLADELLHAQGYLSDATFEVLLPSAEEPVVYDITLQSDATVDSLAPCDYLIRWSTATPGGTNEGFSAYFDGNHYRYRNNRLQEYHMGANPAPFMPLGPGSERNGVQYTAQFADMLPQFLGAKIDEITTDPAFIYKFHADTVVNGRRAVVLDGVKRGDGYDIMTFTYVFDYNTHLPVMTEIESSPGSISEQIVTIHYAGSSAADAIELTEEGLIGEWPEVFERYRESTFRAENLVNTPLPAFSCHILDESERYTHHLNEGFNSPVILVILDPSVATTSETIEAVREAVDMMPMDVEVLWTFNDNNPNAIKEAVGTLRHGEKALTSANSLIRNCGITLYPTIILADRTSKVRDVISGFNNETSMIVLQKAMLMK